MLTSFPSINKFSWSLKKSLQCIHLSFQKRIVFKLANVLPSATMRADFLKCFYVPLFPEVSKKVTQKITKHSLWNVIYAFLYGLVLLDYSREKHAYALKIRRWLERRKFLVKHSMYPYKRDSWAEFEFFIFLSRLG